MLGACDTSLYLRVPTICRRWSRTSRARPKQRSRPRRSERAKQPTRWRAAASRRPSPVQSGAVASGTLPGTPVNYSSLTGSSLLAGALTRESAPVGGRRRRRDAAPTPRWVRPASPPHLFSTSSPNPTPINPNPNPNPKTLTLPVTPALALTLPRSRVIVPRGVPLSRPTSFYVAVVYTTGPSGCLLIP